MIKINKHQFLAGTVHSTETVVVETTVVEETVVVVEETVVVRQFLIGTLNVIINN